MTERTIRSMAKELAGVFYEDNRSVRFRRSFPTIKHYMRGQWIQPSGEILIKEPGWTHHIDLAKKMLVSMLSQSDNRVSTLMKERIYDALIEEHNKSISSKSKTVTQRKLLNV